MNSRSASAHWWADIIHGGDLPPGACPRLAALWRR